jgi:hypothetical protein
MPGLNRRGPNGEGAMTGRKMGRCNPDNKGKTDEEIIQSSSIAAVANPGIGRGRGRGMGKGLGQGLGRGMGMRRGNA